MFEINFLREFPIFYVVNLNFFFIYQLISYFDLKFCIVITQYSRAGKCELILKQIIRKFIIIFREISVFNYNFVFFRSFRYF